MQWISVVLVLVSAAGASERGIDVSKWQGYVNWGQVKNSGISFAVAKATEGNNYVDPKFSQNWEGMKSNSIKAAAYHYLRGAHSPSSQVANILSALKKVGFDFTRNVLAIDVEAGGNENLSADQMADNLQGVLAGLSSSCKNLYIYSSPSYWENKVNWRKYDFSQYNLWIAHYTTKGSPTIPSTWKSKGYTWWQYTDKGSVGGIQGYVDLDRSR